MKKSKFDTTLEFFLDNNKLPVFQGQKEKTIFAKLQKYNLIRVNSVGDIVITSEGEKALTVGVNTYIHALKFEKQLAKEAPALKRQKKILIGLTFILTILLVYTLTKEVEIG